MAARRRSDHGGRHHGDDESLVWLQADRSDVPGAGQVVKDREAYVVMKDHGLLQQAQDAAGRGLPGGQIVLAFAPRPQRPVADGRNVHSHSVVTVGGTR